MGLLRCCQKRLAFALSYVGRHHPTHWGPEENKKVEKDWIHSLPDCLARSQSSTILSNPGSQDFRPRIIQSQGSLNLKQYYLLFWVSSLQMAATGLLSLHEPIPYNKSVHIWICIYGTYMNICNLSNGYIHLHSHVYLSVIYRLFVYLSVNYLSIYLSLHVSFQGESWLMGYEYVCI